MFKRGQALLVIIACLVCLVAYIFINDASYRVESSYRDLQVKTYTVYAEWHRFTGSLRGLLQTFGVFSESLNYAAELKSKTVAKVQELHTLAEPMDPEIRQNIFDFTAGINSGIDSGQRIIDTGRSFLRQTDTPLAIIEGRIPISSILGKDANGILGPMSSYYFFQLIRQLKEMNTLFDSLYSQKMNTILVAINNRAEEIRQRFFLVRLIVLGTTILALAGLIFQLFSLNRFLRNLADRTSEELISTQTHLNKVQSNLQSMQFQQSLFVMVTGIAHELNTPLGNSITISSYMETKMREILDLIRGEALDLQGMAELLNQTNQGFSILSNNLGQMRRQIDTFKLLSTANNDKHDQSMPVNQYLQERLLAYFKNLCPGVAYNYEFGSLGERVLKTGHLNDIFVQLIDNSLVHGNASRVLVRFSDSGKNLQIDFVDNGRGVDDTILAHVGEPFFTSARGKNHMGLGLPIVVSLITNKMGGSIQFGHANPGFTVSMAVPWSILSA